jgi:hypothetical protein
LAEAKAELREISKLEPILECVDRGFGWFGKNLEKVIYTRLQWDFRITRPEIALKPEVFVACLEKFLGPGSKCVERAILREIKSKFPIEATGATDVAGAIEGAKRQLMSH